MAIFSGGLFRSIRISLLLFVLFIVAVDSYLTKMRSTDWDMPLRVVIYPLNGDGGEVAQDYIDRLDDEVFEEIEIFMQEEAKHYKLPLVNPAQVKLGHQVDELPPSPPRNGNFLEVIWFSLKLRYWSFKVDEYEGPTPNVRLYVIYYDPEGVERLDHSLGLEKGLIGVVSVFGHKKMDSQNNFVIAHEFLHTLGASDKYYPQTGEPIFPIGYAEPEREPVYPQELAEVMGGAIPLSRARSEMPKGLFETVIGEYTAAEIKWVD